MDSREQWKVSVVHKVVGLLFWAFWLGVSAIFGFAFLAGFNTALMILAANDLLDLYLTRKGNNIQPQDSQNAEYLGVWREGWRYFRSSFLAPMIFGVSLVIFLSIVRHITL